MVEKSSPKTLCLHAFEPFLFILPLSVCSCFHSLPASPLPLGPLSCCLLPWQYGGDACWGSLTLSPPGLERGLHECPSLAPCCDSSSRPTVFLCQSFLLQEWRDLREVLSSRRTHTHNTCKSDTHITRLLCLAYGPVGKESTCFAFCVGFEQIYFLTLWPQMEVYCIAY